MRGKGFVQLSGGYPAWRVGRCIPPLEPPPTHTHPSPHPPHHTQCHPHTVGPGAVKAGAVLVAAAQGVRADEGHHLLRPGKTRRQVGEMPPAKCCSAIIASCPRKASCAMLGNWSAWRLAQQLYDAAAGAHVRVSPSDLLRSHSARPKAPHTWSLKPILPKMARMCSASQLKKQGF